MTTIEERVAALEHHALLTSTEALSVFTEKLAATANSTERIERQLGEFEAKAEKRFDELDKRLDREFTGVNERFDGVNAQLAAINKLLVRLAGEDGADR